MSLFPQVIESEGNILDLKEPLVDLRKPRTNSEAVDPSHLKVNQKLIDDISVKIQARQ